MMTVLGDHAGYILAAYGFAALVLAAMIGATMMDSARQKKALADLEARGIRRRSDMGA